MKNIPTSLPKYDIPPLLPERGDLDMKGEISTYQKCKRCGGNFKRFRPSTHLTILSCPTCQTTPTRYFLDIYHKGKRYKLPRDQWGNLLASADQANQLLLEIRKHGFRPDKYISLKREPYILPSL